MAEATTTLATVKAVATGIDEAAKLASWVQKQPWYSKLGDILKKKHNFIFLGSTGAGKTNLIESLRSNIPVDIDRAIRTLDASSKTLKVDDTIFNFIDLPGELSKQGIRFDVIRNKYHNKICGIINVVAYGYHEHANGLKSEAVTKQNTPKVLWLRDHKKQELESTLEWVQEFDHMKGSKGLITIATKADLWWEQRDEVVDYYSNENLAYVKSLGPAASLPHSVVPYCSIIKKFYDDCPASGFFDDLERANVRHALVRELLSVAARCSS